MNKLQVIEYLNSIEFVCEKEEDSVDKLTFEPIITYRPDIGLDCLQKWLSKYYVSFKSVSLIEKYEQEPNWENFHTATHFLMLDRIIAAVALEGNVTSCVKECVDLTLKCGNIDLTVLFWVEFYCGININEMVV